LSGKRWFHRPVVHRPIGLHSGVDGFRGPRLKRRIGSSDRRTSAKD
jgi:hypothetical protein